MNDRKIIAKFECRSVASECWGTKGAKKDSDGREIRNAKGEVVTEPKLAEVVKLSPVYGAENKSWNDATPSGELTMAILNEGAQGFIKPGKSYFIVITEAE